MPDFILTAPGGEKYKVTAPDEQSAVGAFKKMLAPSSMADVVGQSARAEHQGSFVDPMLQGATFGFSDEMIGAGGGLANMASGGEFGEAYTATRDASREGLENFRQRNPKTATALEVAGAVPTAAIPLGAMARGTGLGGTMYQGAKAGALAGGLYGVGAADGNIVDRIKGGATGAAVGGTVGGVVPLAGRAVSKVLGVPASRKAMKGLAAGERKIARALADDAVDPATVAALGPDAMPVDLGPNLRQQGAAIAATPGEGQKIIRDAIASRAQGASGRVTSALDHSLGTRANVVQSADDIATARALSAAPLYRQAYAAPVTVTQLIDDVLRTPSGRVALQKAVRLAADEGVPLDPNYIDTRALDYVKRGLDDMIDVAKRAGRNQQARAVTQLKEQMLAELDLQNPAYAQARAAYAGPSSVLDAMEAGQSVFQRSIAPDQLAKEIGRLKGAQLDAFKQGARSQVEQIMGTARNDAGAAWRELAEKGWNREKLALIFGRTQADDLIGRLQAEKTFADTANKITQNSETAARLLGAAEVSGATPLKNIAGRMQDAYSFGGTFGPVRAVIAGTVTKMVDALAGGQSEKVVADMARGLVKTGADRDALINALRLATAQKFASRQMTKKVDRVVTSLLGAGGRATVGPLMAPGN